MRIDKFVRFIDSINAPASVLTQNVLLHGKMAKVKMGL